MASRVFVEPAAEAWTVRSELFDNSMLFSTGARAEQAARDLARRLADAGEPIVLEVRLRDGAKAGRFLFPPRIGGEVDPAARPRTMVGQRVDGQDRRKVAAM